MICPKCGSTIEPGSKFCNNCGAVLTVTPFETVQPTQPVQPVEQFQQVEPVQQAQPVQPVQQTQPVQPVQQTQPVQVFNEYKPEQPVQPVQQVESVQPVQSTQPVQGFNEYKPAESVQSTPPVQPAFKNNNSKKKGPSGGKIALIIIGIFVAFNLLILIVTPIITNSLSKAIIMDSFEEKGLNGEWVSYYAGKMVIEDGNSMTLYPNYSYITEKGEDEYIKTDFTGFKGQRAIDEFRELVGDRFGDDLDYDDISDEELDNMYLLTFEYKEIEAEDFQNEVDDEVTFLVFYDEDDETLGFVDFEDSIKMNEYFRD